MPMPGQDQLLLLQAECCNQHQSATQVQGVRWLQNGEVVVHRSQERIQIPEGVLQPTSVCHTIPRGTLLGYQDWQYTKVRRTSERVHKHLLEKAATNISLPHKIKGRTGSKTVRWKYTGTSRWLQPSVCQQVQGARC